MHPIRNESTPEARAFWAKFEEAGKHAPEWFKERVQERIRKAREEREAG